MIVKQLVKQPLPSITVRCLEAPDLLVGVAGFEPTASSSRTKRATKLRHTPKVQPAQHTGT